MNTIKRRITIDLEFPSGRDLCWDQDEFGSQIFHDLFFIPALTQVSKMMMMRAGELNDTDLDSDQFYQYLQNKYDIVSKTTVVRNEQH